MHAKKEASDISDIYLFHHIPYTYTPGEGDQVYIVYIYIVIKRIKGKGNQNQDQGKGHSLLSFVCLLFTFYWFVIAFLLFAFCASYFYLTICWVSCQLSESERHLDNNTE